MDWWVTLFKATFVVGHWPFWNISNIVSSGQSIGRILLIVFLLISFLDLEICKRISCRWWSRGQHCLFRRWQSLDKHQRSGNKQTGSRAQISLQRPEQINKSIFEEMRDLSPTYTKMEPKSRLVPFLGTISLFRDK